MRGWTHPRARTCLAVLLAAPSLIATAAAATAGAAAVGANPTWKIQPSPDVTRPGGEIHSVSCSSADACTAVGTFVSRAGLYVTLAERWNGTSWTRKAMPNPASDVSSVDSPLLQGVSCPSANFCETVGTISMGVVEPSQAVIADVWNGLSWSAQSVPMPAGTTSANLDAVSCASANFCVAVGSYTDSSGRWALAEGWNGLSWQLQSTPVPAGNLVRFQGVSCITATSCEAVGSFNASSSGTYVGLGAVWDGKTWQLQAMPAADLVTAVSCTSATFCEAVGGNVTAVWDGASWTSQTAPALASANLTGVSCVSPTWCEAVGSGGTDTLAAGWNGTSWQLQATKNPVGGASGGDAFNGLETVSCTDTSNCEAGGYFLRTDGGFTEPDNRALAEYWNGTSWQRQVAAQPRGGTSNVLNSVSCVSATFCAAVGWHFDVSEDQAGLSEVWNGTRWRSQKVPSPAQGSNGLRLFLNGVSCVSARFCEAVGDSFSPSNAIIWNGKTWTAQSVPHPDHLAAVSCPSPTFCVAVGEAGTVLWNGQAWSAMPSDPMFSYNSVSCVSARFCEATGYSMDGSRSYAEVWNGTSWNRQVTPVPSGAANVVLGSVSCPAAGSCEAVGSYENISPLSTVMLAERWNGTAWSIQHPPSPKASTSAALNGVWCTSASRCAAVGAANTSPGPVALAWNGTSWSLQPTASLPPSASGAFRGVSCGLSYACTAVGSFGYRERFYSASTLVEVGG